MREEAEPIRKIARLRLAVGTLGERDGSCWWNSSFMAPASSAFLAPVFGDGVSVARYESVMEAARRVHDDRIGVGRAFHPFRLPEAVERRVMELVRSEGAALIEECGSQEAAHSILESLAKSSDDGLRGPVLIGPVEAAEGAEWIAEAAGLYQSAIRSGAECFPYFAGSR